MEIMLANVLGKGPHLLDSNAFFWAKFNPDSTDSWRGRIGVGGSRQDAVFMYHSLRWAGGEGHFLAAVERLDLAWTLIAQRKAVLWTTMWIGKLFTKIVK